VALKMIDVGVNTDASDVLYNKFSYLPTHPHSDLRCIVARSDWRATRCSKEHYVVCQEGLTLKHILTTPRGDITTN